MSSVRTQVEQVEQYVEPENEWTIMIFFAGDPHLSPSMTAQLKSLKDAGFQDHTTVLVHYDPNEKGVATTTFEINRQRKADLRAELKKNNPNNESATRIGDGKNPFVRNLREDSIDEGPRTDNAEQALRAFLDIGTTKYSAKHYIVCLVGHGVIVGNDAFLPDRHPESAITLEQLGDIMRHFKRSIKDGAFELIGMHSCSMSAIEVLYELKGTAKYMMATEGVSFVTSWPYRQLLKKILNAIDETKTRDGKPRNGKASLDVNELIESMHGLSLHNSTDFMFSGLSADISLCRLDENLINDLTPQLKKLTEALKAGLNDKRGLELIRLAHLEAQSYWQETYTDLYDFCLCLERQCNLEEAVQKEMAKACEVVRDKLEESSKPDSLIIQSDYFGPLFQYSHGLSILFPWSRPLQEEPVILNDGVLTRYEKYEFTKALGTDSSWFSFLEEYFAKTKRKSRDEEDIKRGVRSNVSDNGRQFRGSTATGIVGTSTGGNPESLEKASGALEKASGALTDIGCGCSVKNYPMEFFLSPRASQEFNKREANTTSSDNGVAQSTKAKTEKKTARATAKTNERNKTRRPTH